MKKIIFAIMLAAGAFGAYAETSEITTSQYYVDTKLSEKQDAASANNANSVMTYDSTSADGIGAKAIYNTSSAYETQKAALVTAGAANAAIQNAVNMEFTCANPPKCTLWDMTAQTHLPTGYTELEYVVFDGDSYIDTGVVLTSPAYMENVLTVKAKTISTFQTFTGFMPAHEQIVPRYGIHIYTEKWMGGANVTLIAADSADTNRHTLKFVTTDSSESLYKDNILLRNHSMTLQSFDTVISENFHTNTLSIYLGARHNLAGAENYFVGDIGRAYLKQNGVMLYNYIPCKNSNNQVGFYDTVSGTFKTNSGAGTLTAGPVASYLPQNQ